MKISILGAGVGGLSTAIALKLKGFDVEIFERHSVLSDIGAGIVCWPNASFVLGELGLLADIDRVSGKLTRMQRLSDSGESLGYVDILKLNEHMGYPSYSILRHDLMKILSRRASDLGIKVLYDHRVVAIDSSTDSLAHISFDNGTSRQSEVVIGADGRMDSVARQFVLGNNTPVYQGFINWIGVFESDHAVFDDIAVSDYWGIGERFGIVPISANKAYWAGGVTAKEIGDRNLKLYKSELMTVFKDWPDPITMMIKETPIMSINKIYVHDHDPMDAWHRANVLLVGDAAHAPLPTSGQGACQALEDAWHLSRLLDENSADICAVFSRFTRERQAKTAGITMGARQFAASLFNANPDYCLQRNEQSKNTDYNAVVFGMAKGWSSGLPIGALSKQE